MRDDLMQDIIPIVKSLQVEPLKLLGEKRKNIMMKDE